MDWAKRLELAKLNKTFTEEDKKLAGSWETCVIGFKPELNSELYQLGIAFEYLVKNNFIESAEKTYENVKRLQRVTTES